MGKERWPKIAGKAIAAYTTEATLTSTEGEFLEKFQAYVKRMNLGQDVDSATALNLFKITVEFQKQQAAVSAMKKANIEDDWRMRKRFISGCTKELAVVRGRSMRALQKKNAPLTCMLAQSVRKKVDTLLRELERVSEFQRGQEAMFRILRPSVNGERSCVLMLSEYMKDRFPGLPKSLQDIIIAGAMIAAGIKRDVGDPIANIPMARMRASKLLDEDGLVVPWLNGTDVPNGTEKS